MRLSNPRAFLTRLSKLLPRLRPPPSLPLAATKISNPPKKMQSQRKAEEYAGWSHAALISRVLELEKSMEEYEKKLAPKQKRKKPFNPALYSTRDIALKIAYLGGNYCGFEYHVNCPTPLPTIEEELFKVLLKARLVPCNPGTHEDDGVQAWPGDDVAGYSKCGRTDRGVSAFGQVIGVRVRSNRPLPKPVSEAGKKETEDVPQEDSGMTLDDGFGVALGYQSETEEEEPEFDDIKDELPYPQILNRLLPSDIKVLAWCPSLPEGFSARFNCRERQYKYFFTNPAIAPSANGTGNLDIAAMQKAAQLYVGTHDFRNFCKLDASKQISNFERIIRRASIEEVAPSPPSISGLLQQQTPSSAPAETSADVPKIYTFTLHGSAFLWHQVRHMVAVLFLIGQGLEKPSLITELLDVQKFPRKPLYGMADDRPLVLWDCVFSEGELSWIYAEENMTLKGPGKEGRDGLVDTVWATWHKARIDEVLAAGLLDAVSAAAKDSNERGRQINSSIGAERKRSRSPPDQFVVTRAVQEIAARVEKPRSQIVVDGGDEPVYRGKYVSVLERKTMDDVEVINRRYAEKKGDWKENRRKMVERKNGEEVK